MPKTEVQKRKDYYRRVIQEETARAKRDEKYTAYLSALSALVEMTDDIYAKGGAVTTQQHQQLLDSYNSLIGLGAGYLEYSDNTNRRKLISEIGQYIRKDAKAIADMNPEVNGNLKDVISEGRSIMVEVPAGKNMDKVGNYLSSRYAVKTAKGQQGFFTAASTGNMSEGWKAIINKHRKFFTEKELKSMEKFANNTELQRLLAIEARGGREVQLELMASAFGIKLLKERAGEVDPAYTAQQTVLTKMWEEARGLMESQRFHKFLLIEEQSRIDNRNVAMYLVAKAVGCEDVVARAEPMIMVQDGKKIKGTFMETAQGGDFARPQENGAIMQANLDSFADSAQFRKQYSKLCVVDYICGNNDRHRRNMIYEFDNSNPPKCIGVKGIDNDTSFPNDDYDLSAKNSYWMPTADKLKVMDEQTARMVMSLDKTVLKTMLRGTKLTDKEIGLAWERAEKLKLGIMSGKIKIISDWEKEVPEKYNPLEYGLLNDLKTEIKYLNTKKAIGTLTYAADINYTEGKEISEKDKVLFTLDTVKSLEGKMKETDTFYRGSAEFNNMRDKLYRLGGVVDSYGKNLAEADKNSQQFKEFAQALKEFSEATKEYIGKKSLQPLTSHGNKRLDFAKKLQDRAWEIAENAGIDLDEVKKEEPKADGMEI